VSTRAFVSIPLSARMEFLVGTLVEPEEAYANAVNKQELRSMLERAGVKLEAA
jgi:hypothetical protein